MDTRQQKSRMWTWLILLFLLGLGVVIANVVISNPQLTEEGVDAAMGMPAWAFPGIVAFIGLTNAAAPSPSTRAVPARIGCRPSGIRPTRLRAAPAARAATSACDPT